VRAGAAAAGETDPFAHPPALERDIRFWIRVYTEVTTDQGCCTMTGTWAGLRGAAIRPGIAAVAARTAGGGGQARYAALLRRFADGSTDDLTPHEQRILHAFAMRRGRPIFARPSTAFASSWGRPTAFEKA